MTVSYPLKSKKTITWMVLVVTWHINTLTFWTEKMRSYSKRSVKWSFKWRALICSLWRRKISYRSKYKDSKPKWHMLSLTIKITMISTLKIMKWRGCRWHLKKGVSVVVATFSLTKGMAMVAAAEWSCWGAMSFISTRNQRQSFKIATTRTNT